MANFVPTSPGLPRAISQAPSVTALARYDAVLNTALFKIFSEIAVRVNNALVKDGTEAMSGPLKLASYTVGTLPDEATYVGSLIFVTDETGGPTVAYSDGSDWLRVYDNAVVS